MAAGMSATVEDATVTDVWWRGLAIRAGEFVVAERSANLLWCCGADCVGSKRRIAVSLEEPQFVILTYTSRTIESLTTAIYQYIGFYVNWRHGKLFTRSCIEFVETYDELLEWKMLMPIAETPRK